MGAHHAQGDVVHTCIPTSNSAEGQQAWELPPRQNATPGLTCTVTLNDSYSDILAGTWCQDEYSPCIMSLILTPSPWLVELTRFTDEKIETQRLKGLALDCSESGGAETQGQCPMREPVLLSVVLVPPELQLLAVGEEYLPCGLWRGCKITPVTAPGPAERAHICAEAMRLPAIPSLPVSPSV